jgi:hypothetical protein
MSLCAGRPCASGKTQSNVRCKKNGATQSNDDDELLQYMSQDINSMDLDALREIYSTNNKLSQDAVALILQYTYLAMCSNRVDVDNQPLFRGAEQLDSFSELLLRMPHVYNPNSKQLYETLEKLRTTTCDVLCGFESMLAWWALGSSTEHACGASPPRPANPAILMLYITKILLVVDPESKGFHNLPCDTGCNSSTEQEQREMSDLTQKKMHDQLSIAIVRVSEHLNQMRNVWLLNEEVGHERLHTVLRAARANILQQTLVYTLSDPVYRSKILEHTLAEVGYDFTSVDDSIMNDLIGDGANPARLANVTFKYFAYEAVVDLCAAFCTRLCVVRQNIVDSGRSEEDVKPLDEAIKQVKQQTRHMLKEKQQHNVFCNSEILSTPPNVLGIGCHDSQLLQHATILDALICRALVIPSKTKHLNANLVMDAVFSSPLEEIVDGGAAPTSIYAEAADLLRRRAFCDHRSTSPRFWSTAVATSIVFFRICLSAIRKRVTMTECSASCVAHRLSAAIPEDISPTRVTWHAAEVSRACDLLVNRLKRNEPRADARQTQERLDRICYVPAKTNDGANLHRMVPGLELGIVCEPSTAVNILLPNFTKFTNMKLNNFNISVPVLIWSGVLSAIDGSRPCKPLVMPSSCASSTLSAALIASLDGVTQNDCFENAEKVYVNDYVPFAQVVNSNMTYLAQSTASMMCVLTLFAPISLITAARNLISEYAERYKTQTDDCPLMHPEKRNSFPLKSEMNDLYKQLVIKTVDYEMADTYPVTYQATRCARPPTHTRMGRSAMRVDHARCVRFAGNW